jgi:hypothetical protein
MLLRWLLHVLGVDDAPDPAWHPTGYRITTPPGHDEAIAAAAVKRGEALAEARRKIAAQRSAPPPDTAPRGPRR